MFSGKLQDEVLLDDLNEVFKYTYIIIHKHFYIEKHTE